MIYPKYLEMVSCEYLITSILLRGNSILLADTDSSILTRMQWRRTCLRAPIYSFGLIRASVNMVPVAQWDDLSIARSDLNPCSAGIPVTPGLIYLLISLIWSSLVRNWLSG